jgi:hypothetical protein
MTAKIQTGTCIFTAPTAFSCIIIILCDTILDKLGGRRSRQNLNDEDTDCVASTVVVIYGMLLGPYNWMETLNTVCRIYICNSADRERYGRAETRNC